MNLAANGFEWESDQEPVSDEVAPSKIIPAADYRVTIYHVNSIPKSLIYSLIGKVNSTSFGEAEAESLMFIGADAQREVNSGSTPSWRLELFFQYSPVSHNKFFRADTGNYEKIVTKTGQNPVYETTSFDALLSGGFV